MHLFMGEWFVGYGLVYNAIKSQLAVIMSYQRIELGRFLRLEVIDLHVTRCRHLWKYGVGLTLSVLPAK